MILLALYDLAEREQLVADPDFPLVPIPWLVTVSRDGTVLGITDTRSDQPGGGKGVSGPRRPSRAISDRPLGNQGAAQLPRR